MRKFGTYHNLMHEWMSEWARYFANNEDLAELVPDFEERISGGEWTALREAMEEAGENEWLDFVQVVEVMHDWVHQAMLYAIIFDNENYSRNLDISTYADEDRMAHEINATLPGLPGNGFDEEVVQQFRERAWHAEKDGAHHHSAWQLMIAFEEMTQDLTNLWAKASWEAFKAHECLLLEGIPSEVVRNWNEYALRSEACTDEPWMSFVQSTAWVQERIHLVLKVLLSKDA